MANRPNTDNKLSHLTGSQIDDLISRYYSGEKVSDLISEYRIQTIPSTLVSLFPPVVHNDSICPYCNAMPMITKRQSRSAYRLDTPICPNCGHRDSPNCNCEHCTERAYQFQQSENAEKRSVVEDQFGSVEKYNTASEPTFLDALFLLSIVRHSLSEDLKFVDPFISNPPKLAPTYVLTEELVAHLRAKGILSISVDSDIEAFVFDEGLTTITGYYPTRVKWTFLPGYTATDKKSLISDIEETVRNSEWPDKWYVEADAAWHLIGKYECLEYFDYLLRQRDFKIETFGDKTHAVFEEILKRYSIAQSFNITWMAVRDTVDYLAKEGVPRYKGKNHFIGSVQRKAERATANKWNVKPSRRDFGCPQTVLSSTYFNLFVEIGDEGFEKPLPKE